MYWISKEEQKNNIEIQEEPYFGDKSSDSNIEVIMSLFFLNNIRDFKKA